MLLSTSRPPILGNIISSSTILGFSRQTACIAASPSRATSTDQPSLVRIKWSDSNIAGSSSTIRISTISFPPPCFSGENSGRFYRLPLGISPGDYCILQYQPKNRNGILDRKQSETLCEKYCLWNVIKL